MAGPSPDPAPDPGRLATISESATTVSRAEQKRVPIVLAAGELSTRDTTEIAWDNDELARNGVTRGP